MDFLKNWLCADELALIQTLQSQKARLEQANRKLSKKVNLLYLVKSEQKLKLMEEITQLLTEIDELEERYTTLEELMEFEGISLLEKRMNSKYPLADITYSARYVPKHTSSFEMDVKSFIFDNDFKMQKIVDNFNLRQDTHDKSARKCQQWVRRSIRYEFDFTSTGYVEFWLFPNETYRLKMGDCEDQALLETSLMLHAGVPSFRQKILCGYVGPEDYGHAYQVYLRQLDDEWVINDCTWFIGGNDTKAMSQRPLAKEHEGIGDIWWGFNNEIATMVPNFETTAKKNPEEFKLMNEHVKVVECTRMNLRKE